VAGGRRDVGVGCELVRNGVDGLFGGGAGVVICGGDWFNGRQGLSRGRDCVS
jgi:hypothetical protein